MRVLITGGGGMLARAFREMAGRREGENAGNFDVIALTHTQLDITSYDDVRAALRRTTPDVVINCAAYTKVDDAETHEAEAMRINGEGAGILADACGSIRVVYPSTDYVFDGNAATPYKTDAPTNPINAYGRSKLAGEQATAKASNYLIVRTSWLYGPGGPNFVRTILTRKDQPLRVVNDQVGRPTFTYDLAQAIARLIDEPSGIYHAVNDGTASWYDFARAIAPAADITPCTSEEFPRPAARPRYSVLEPSLKLRDWHDALADALRAGAY